MAQSELQRMAADDREVIVVAMDPGVFEWLYEMVKSRSRQHQWMESYRALTQRALVQFQEAAGDLPPVPEPARKRVIPPRQVAPNAGQRTPQNEISHQHERRGQGHE